jgi:hypothetical protein
MPCIDSFEAAVESGRTDGDEARRIHPPFARWASLRATQQLDTQNGTTTFMATCQKLTLPRVECGGIVIMSSLFQGICQGPKFSPAQALAGAGR